MIKRKKKQAIGILTLVACIALPLCTASKKVKASSNPFYYVSTSVGEVETSVGINFHSSLEKAEIVYGTSSSLTNASRIETTSHVFEKGATLNDDNSIWTSRYVHKVFLNDLLESTKYYYKIVSGSSSSDVYSFTTGEKNASTQSILLTSDIHASMGYNTTAKSSAAISTILRKAGKNINLILSTGDMVDRGGYESEWKAFFEGEAFVKNYMLATIPGNHEYYLSSDSAYVNPSIYNEFFANPQNGDPTMMNSSYYFHYGSALIIMIDTIARSNLREQQAWFRKVIEENPAEWIIVGTHAGGITGGSYKGDAQWIKQNWTPLFEEAQVDLAVSGHEHLYARQDLIYKSNTDEDKGVTYLVSPATGHKLYAAEQASGMTIQNVNFAASVLSFFGEELVVTTYDTDGNTLQSFALAAKRPTELTTLTKEQIQKGIHFQYNKEEEAAIFTWDESFYGNVKKVIIEEQQDNYKFEQELSISSGKMTSLKFTNIYKVYDYSFHVSIYTNDNEVIKYDEFVENIPTHNIKYNVNGGANPEDAPKSYKEGSKLTLPIPTYEGMEFKGWFLNREGTGDPITEITKDMKEDIKLYAIWEKIVITPEPTKKGCKSGTLLLSTLSAISLAFVFFRKQQ